MNASGRIVGHLQNAPSAEFGNSHLTGRTHSWRLIPFAPPKVQTAGSGKAAAFEQRRRAGASRETDL